VADPQILLVYHSSEGQTAKVAQRIAEVLRGDGMSVDVREAEDAPAPAGYDGVVAGDSIHVVHHSRALVRYLKDHSDALDGLPTALFQVSLSSANPDDEHTADAHHMVNQLLEQTTFDPDIVGMFAGRLAYTQYGWIKRHVMKSVAKHEGADTDTTHDTEYTDWAAVDHFAHDVGTRIREAMAHDAG